MKKASPVTFLAKRARMPEKKEAAEHHMDIEENLDLNIFVVTFNGMKEAESEISGGDPYTCMKCKAILNKYSTVLSAKEFAESSSKAKVELKNN